jgi:hypothetical protein
MTQQTGSSSVQDPSIPIQYQHKVKLTWLPHGLLSTKEQGLAAIFLAETLVHFGLPYKSCFRLILSKIKLVFRNIEKRQIERNAFLATTTTTTALHLFVPFIEGYCLGFIPGGWWSCVRRLQHRQV